MAHAPKPVGIGIDVTPLSSRLCSASLVYKSGSPSVTPSVISNALGFRSTPTVVAEDDNNPGALVMGEAAKKAISRELASRDNKGEVMAGRNALSKLHAGDDKDALAFFGHLKELAAEASGVGMKVRGCVFGGSKLTSAE